MASLLLGLQSNGGKLSGWKKKLNNAWGISNKFLGRTMDTFIDADFEVERKIRSDKGVSIFTDETKRRHTFTALNQYKTMFQHVKVKEPMLLGISHWNI